MKKFLALLLVFACSHEKKANDIQLIAFRKNDTIYYYQDGEGYFLAPGLHSGLHSGKVQYANLIATVSVNGADFETELTKDNFKPTDTLWHDLRETTLTEDDTIEIVGQPPLVFRYNGELRYVYEQRDTVSLRDTISFVLINPLTSNKMSGQLINGKRSGYWREYNDVEKLDLARSSYFVDGLRNGMDTIFRDGGIYLISEWSLGKKDGWYRTYYQNGQINSELLFDKGRAIDPMVFYSNKGAIIDSAYIFSENPTTQYTTGSISE